MKRGTIEIELADLEATNRLGQALGQALFPDAVVGLVGPLGAGKTHLVRAIAEGLDIPNSRVVSSPTFVLIQEYDARLPIYHFDAYRLGSEREFLDLGISEYFSGAGVCLVEWADRVASALPAERLMIDMQVTGATSRTARLEASGARYVKLLALPQAPSVSHPC